MNIHPPDEEVTDWEECSVVEVDSNADKKQYTAGNSKNPCVGESSESDSGNALESD